MNCHRIIKKGEFCGIAKNEKHWLLIIGDDRVIPFYRAKDPVSGDGLTKGFSGHFNVTEHVKDLALNKWFFSESIYQDTDGSGWGDGAVDSMYVGRILSDDVSNLNSIISNYMYDLDIASTIQADSFTFSSGERENPCSAGVDVYRNDILKAKPYFEQAGFNVACQTDGTTSSNCENGIWSEGCLLGAERNIDPTTGVCTLGDTWDYVDFHFSVVNAYRDHGSKDALGLGGVHTNIEASDIDQQFDNPTFHSWTCLAGLADGDAENIFAHAFLRNEYSSFVGATIPTSTTFNGDFLVNFYKKFTGQSRNFEGDWQSVTPTTIGEALNSMFKFFGEELLKNSTRPSFKRQRWCRF